MQLGIVPILVSCGIVFAPILVRLGTILILVSCSTGFTPILVQLLV